MGSKFNEALVVAAILLPPSVVNLCTKEVPAFDPTYGSVYNSKASHSQHRDMCDALQNFHEKLVKDHSLVDTHFGTESPGREGVDATWQLVAALVVSYRLTPPRPQRHDDGGSLPRSSLLSRSPCPLSWLR